MLATLLPYWQATAEWQVSQHQPTRSPLATLLASWQISQHGGTPASTGLEARHVRLCGAGRCGRAVICAELCAGGPAHGPGRRGQGGGVWGCSLGCAMGICPHPLPWRAVHQRAQLQMCVAAQFDHRGRHAGARRGLGHRVLHGAPVGTIAPPRCDHTPYCARRHPPPTHPPPPPPAQTSSVHARFAMAFGPA